MQKKLEAQAQKIHELLEKINRQAAEIEDLRGRLEEIIDIAEVDYE